MPQVDEKKRQRATSGGGGAGDSRQTKAPRESIEIEKRQGKRRADCVGPAEAFVDCSSSSSSPTTSSSPSTGSQSEGSGRASVSPPQPPLTLIDASPAQAGLPQLREHQAPSGLSSDKSHQASAAAAAASERARQAQVASPVGKVGARSATSALDKFSSFASCDKQRAGFHSNEPERWKTKEAAKEEEEAEDELNNNSIHAAQVQPGELGKQVVGAQAEQQQRRQLGSQQAQGEELQPRQHQPKQQQHQQQQTQPQKKQQAREQQAQQQQQGQSVKSSSTSLSPSISLRHAEGAEASRAPSASQPVQQHREPASTISPLGLLTGLRMHTNNLRSQQQQQHSQQRQEAQQLSQQLQQSGESYRRKPQQPTTTTSSVVDFQSQLSSQQAQQATSGTKFPTPATPSPASFVESSLNPDENEQPRQEQKQTRAQAPTGYIPSYTSLFASGKPTSPPVTHSPQQNAPSSSTTPDQQQQQQQQSTSGTTTSLWERRQQPNRNPLRKQEAHLDLSSTSAPRSLFLTSTSKKSPVGASQQRPPSAQNEPAAQPARKLPLVFDYSASSRRLKSPVDYDVESQLDDPDQTASSSEQSQEDEEEDDELADEEELDEKSPFSGSRGNSRRSRSDRHHQLSSSRDSIRQRVPPLDSLAHKYPGSAKLSRHLIKARGQAEVPQTRSNSHRIIMSSPSSKTKHGQQHSPNASPPQVQHSRISDQMSRPPSFGTTTAQGQQHRNYNTGGGGSCRRVDLLEQVAHLECSCHSCSKNRKLASLHDNLYYSHSHQASNGKLAQFDHATSNSATKLTAVVEKRYPKTHFMHMILKSIILVLCTLLLLLLLVGSIMLSISLPHSMDKMVNASRSFNVTIAGRR